MKKILIITEDNCDDSELLYPYYRITEQGWQPVVAALTEKTVRAKYHFTVGARSTDGISAEDYDGLVIPGGTAPEKLRQNRAAVNLVRDFVSSGKPVAAICHGPQLLISAGAAAGKRMTGYPGIADDIRAAGGDYTDEPAVVYGNIVTSRRPCDLPYFMKEFIALAERKKS